MKMITCVIKLIFFFFLDYLYLFIYVCYGDRLKASWMLPCLTTVQNSSALIHILNLSLSQGRSSEISGDLSEGEAVSIGRDRG